MRWSSCAGRRAGSPRVGLEAVEALRWAEPTVRGDDGFELRRGRAVHDHAVARRGRTGGARARRSAAACRSRPARATRRAAAWRRARASRCRPWRRAHPGTTARRRRRGSARGRRGPSRFVSTSRSPYPWRYVARRPDGLLEPQRPRGCRRGSSRSTTRCGRSTGRGPPRSAASRTMRTQRSTVSSVKNVCSTTMSKARPASASELGPKATSPSGMSSSNDASRCSTGKLPGRPVVAEDHLAAAEAAQRARRSPPSAPS